MEGKKIEHPMFSKEELEGEVAAIVIEIQNLQPGDNEALDKVIKHLKRSAETAEAYKFHRQFP